MTSLYDKIDVNELDKKESVLTPREKEHLQECMRHNHELMKSLSLL